MTSSPATVAPSGTLAAQALACRRGRRRLFSGLDLTLPPGRLTWLRGANGSGKTSLLRILAGLSAPAEGQVLWNGQPLARAGDAARERLHYIGHANALKDDLTLAEALAFLAQLQGLDAPQRRATAALERLGLASRAGALVRTLSQGQRRRGALARLALDEATPCTWLLDEPFDALDQASVATLAALIQAQAARGGAVLFTSHQAVPLAGLHTVDLGAAPARSADRAAA
ncbi:cytochrome c biogenesis heme-transporting ATPase CcmA [Ideonella sp. DXS22W]|uniref:Cytochrome c biogenesis heme-transporting ATPase CcmA n=1 Tax=Pseudaquabacterium inlustre TaxID=2984192 RepID=A0ABU9CD15_9BURK